MHLPSKINICGYCLRINYKAKLVVNGVECFGVYDEAKKIIYLVKGMTPIRKKEIFLHEFIHFLADIYRVDLKDHDVASFALGLLQLLSNSTIKWDS